MDRSGPGGQWGPQPPMVELERSGPPWTTLRHFPDNGDTIDTLLAYCHSPNPVYGQHTLLRHQKV